MIALSSLCFPLFLAAAAEIHPVISGLVSSFSLDVDDAQLLVPRARPCSAPALLPGRGENHDVLGRCPTGRPLGLALPQVW